MKRIALTFSLPIALWAADGAAPSKAAAEFGSRWTKTRRLAVGVAEAMPEVQYAFRPDPGSMTFAEQLAHIAWANYAFCAGLKDAAAPPASTLTGKDALVKLMGDSFDYCSATIAALTDEQLDRPHDSPDGRMPGREILLALYATWRTIGDRRRFISG
jgi:DinB superfamily